MLFQWSAMPKPRIRLLNSSMRAPRLGATDREGLQRFDVGAERNGQLQSHDEHERGEYHEENSQPEDLPPLELMAAEAGAHDEHHAREQHADRLEKDAEENDRDEDIEDRSPMELLELGVFARLGMSKRDHRDEDAQADEDHPQPEREKRRPHARGRPHGVAGHER